MLAPLQQRKIRIFHAVGMGDLRIEVPNGAMSNKALLKDMLYVLGILWVHLRWVPSSQYYVLCINVQGRRNKHQIERIVE